MKEGLLTQWRLFQFGDTNEEMPFTKIDAFFEECPWIGKIVSRKDVQQVHVRRIDASLLLYKPEKSDYGSLLPKYVYEEIFLLDKEGKLLGFSNPVFRKKYWIYGKLIHIKDKIVKAKINTKSSVQQQLRQMPSGVTRKVRYLLSYYSYTRAVILYKIPENISLSDWLEKEAKQEKVAFRKELESIE